MAIRILHLADIHLGAVHQFLPPEKQARRTGEILESFEELLTGAMDGILPVNAVIISGDLFDSPDPTPELISRVKRVFDRLTEKNIPILLVPGNHDNVIAPDSVFNRVEFPGVIVLNSPFIAEPIELSLEDTEFHFYGMTYSYLSKPPFDAFRPRNSDVQNIAIIHGALKDNPEWRLHTQDIPLQTENLLRTGFDYIGLGHYHNFLHREGNGTHVVYPGSLEPLGWTEEGKRQVVIVEFEDGEVRINSVPFAGQRRYFKTFELNCDLHSFEATEDITKYVMERFADPKMFFRLILKGQLDFIPDITQLAETCADQFYYFRCEDRTAITAPEKIRSLSNENTIRGLAVSKLISLIENAPGEQEKNTAREALKILMGHFSNE